MSVIIDSYTIEPSRDGDGFWLVAHGEYEQSSVLAGEPSRTLVHWYATVDEAIADNPGVDALSHSTHIEVFMPQSAPDWFDPLDAGEVWHEEDY